MQWRKGKHKQSPVVSLSSRYSDQSSGDSKWIEFAWARVPEGRDLCRERAPEICSRVLSSLWLKTKWWTCRGKFHVPEQLLEKEQISGKEQLPSNCELSDFQGWPARELRSYWVLRAFSWDSNRITY